MPILSSLLPTTSRSGVAGTVMSGAFLSTVVVSFLFILGVSIVVPVLPMVVDEYGVSRAGGGLLLSSFAFGRLAFDLIAGVLGDRFGIRRVAIVACLVTMVASVIAATAPAYPMLLGARVLQGAGSALYMTVAMSHVITIAPEGHVGRLLAIYQGVILAGVSFGPTFGGLVAQAWGIAGPFLLYASFGIIGAAVALRWMPVQDRRSDPASASASAQARWPQVRRLLADPTFLLVLLAAFAVFSTRAGTGNTLLPLFAAERFGFTQAAIGVLLTAVAVGNLVVLVHAGRSVDRAGRRRTLRTGLWTTVPVTVGLAIAATPWALFALAAGLGAAKGYASVVPGAVLSDLASPAIRSTAVGIQRMTTDFGLLVGPFLSGAMADRFGFTVAFALTGAFVAAVALATALMRETADRPAPVRARLSWRST